MATRTSPGPCRCTAIDATLAAVCDILGELVAGVEAVNPVLDAELREVTAASCVTFRTRPSRRHARPGRISNGQHRICQARLANAAQVLVRTT